MVNAISSIVQAVALAAEADRRMREVRPALQRDLFFVNGVVYTMRAPRLR